MGDDGHGALARHEIESAASAVRPGPSGDTIAFVPVASIDGQESRIHSLRCLRLPPSARSLDSARLAEQADRAPWNAKSLPGALQAVSVLPFDLDFAFLVGPGMSETIDAVRQLSDPVIPHPIRFSRMILELPATVPDLQQYVGEALEHLRASCMRLALRSDPDVSSHSALLRLRPDYLTLPRALVDGISSDPDRQMVVESIAGLAWKLGTKVIAEGLRTSSDGATLQAMGIELATGALFRGPWRLADLEDWEPRFARPRAPNGPCA